MKFHNHGEGAHLVGAFYQEKTLLGAFSMIVKSSRRLVSSSSIETDCTSRLWYLHISVTSFY